MEQTKKSAAVDRTGTIARIMADFDSGGDPPDMFTFGDLPAGVPYAPTRHMRATVHVGQFKLFLSELRFLTAEGALESDAIVIYAGSAPGHHDAFLASLFPRATFVLIDPSPHSIRGFGSRETGEIAKKALFYRFSDARFNRKLATDAQKSDAHPPPAGTMYVDHTGAVRAIVKDNLSEIKTIAGTCGSAPVNNADATGSIAETLAAMIAARRDIRFHIVEDYFDPRLVAKIGADRPVLYVSDIRSNLVAAVATDLDILANNAMQHMWVREMRPRASMLKFHPPYYNADGKRVLAEFANSRDSIPFARRVFADYLSATGIDLVADYLAGAPYKWLRASRLDVQMFPGSSSSESRAIIKTDDIDAPIFEWDASEYEDRFYAYNIAREFLFYEKNRPVFSRASGIDGCCDCNMMIDTFRAFLLAAKRPAEAADIRKMIADCLASFARRISTAVPGIMEHGRMFVRISLQEALTRERAQMAIPSKK